LRQQHDLAAGQGGGLGGARGPLPGRAVGHQRRHQLLEHRSGRGDALAVRPPRVGLDQDAQAVAGRGVEVREPRRRLAVGEARGRVVVLVEGRVEAEGQMAARGHAVEDAGLQRPGRRLEVIAAPGLGRDHHRDVVLELRAVGGVQVDEQRRLPPRPQRQERAHLGRVGLDEIAVQVEAGGGGAEPHLLGAALVGPMVGAEPLVAVDVEGRDEHDADPRQGPGRHRAGQQIAGEREPGVLAVDLAGVDPGQREQDRRVGGQVGAPEDHRDHRPARGRRAEHLASGLARVGRRQVVAQPHGLVVTAGLQPSPSARWSWSGSRGAAARGGASGDDEGGEGERAAHPRLVAHRPAAAPPADRAATDGTVAPMSHRVLLVEDDLALREVTGLSPGRGRLRRRGGRRRAPLPWPPPPRTRPRWSCST
jgi:hypothetical protein